MHKYRIGTGYDVHKLVKNRPLILGGVTVPHHSGLEGHSDADVLTHAVMDALLGAAGLRDIGYYFPPADASFKDADSINLLGQVMDLINQAGFTMVVNVDTVIMAQQPKLLEHIPKMRENLARAMKIEPESISIKATTTEKLGFVGREEGIAATAVCLLAKD